jgi:hypothetical protein
MQGCILPRGCLRIVGGRRADLIQKGGAVPPLAAAPECGMSSEAEHCFAQQLCRGTREGHLENVENMLLLLLVPERS